MGCNKKIDDRVYEDEDFIISYLNFGEWGETTWFIDKHTQKEYEINIDGTTVNRLNGCYYLTGGVIVRKIENPLHLIQCDPSNYYHEVEKKSGKFYRNSFSLIGSKVIYEDTTFSPYSFKEPKQYIITSFVFKDQLYQLYSDSNTTFIGKIENKKLIPIQDIGKKYSIFSWYHSYRGKNLANNSRFLKFKENNNTFGFIEIYDNNINIHYLIHDIDSLEYLGSDGFEILLDLVKVNSDSLSFKKMDSIEKKMGGIDMKTDKVGISHNRTYPDIYKSMDVKTKRYIKVEDKHIAQETEYLYLDANKTVKSIFITWSSTKHYKKNDYFPIDNEKHPDMIKSFKKKQDEIIAFITKYLGVNPQKEDRGNNLTKLTWTLNSGLEIKLYGSNTFDGILEISMIINIP